MKRIIFSGIVTGTLMFLVAMGFGFLSNTLFPELANEYLKDNIFRPWSDPLMSLYFAYPFILGLILSVVWDKVKVIISGNTIERGVKFALWYILVATVSGMLITYSSFQVSLLMVFTWTISGILEALVAGVVLARMNR